MLKQFLKSIEQFGSFSEADQKLITEQLKPINLEKGTFILEQGRTCQSAYFVNKGSLRHYRDLDGYSEVTINLFIENNWVLDHTSFTSQSKSTNNIQAYEDCELLELSMQSMHELVALSPAFFRLGKILEPPRNEEKLQLKTPEERYIDLMNEKPELIQRFPLKHIASYLGMTPETLSRVRAKVKF